jgi:transposase
MEPTGHYWKPLAHYLRKAGYRVVGVNPYHTKKAKELDDNSPTKSDKKDALTIARLVKDGRFFDPYLPEDIYAELRVLTNGRVSTMKRSNAVKNTIIAIVDEYFPEIYKVFRKPLTGKASRQVLRSCPFPSLILKLGAEGVLSEIKKAVKKTVGMKKVMELIEAAQESIGVSYGLLSAKQRLDHLLDELEMVERHLSSIEASMEELLIATGYGESLLSVKGIGIVTAASFLGEVGDPLRFQNARQIANYAGYNLVEDSSGKNKSGTCISKRGRSQLRSLLYKMAFTMVGQNEEMKALHKHLTTRVKNPLKKKQSLVVISKKIITVIYSLLKKQAKYDPALVLGAVRREMLKAA